MKNVLIVEPSTSGLNLLPMCQQLGLNCIVLTANTDERIIPDVYKKYITKEIHVDTNNFQALRDETLILHRTYPLSAIIPGFEIFVEQAAYLSDLLGLPGVSPDTGKILRNKWLMRKRMVDYGLRVPKHWLIKSLSDIENLHALLPFPCVIKPIDQSGSIHVSLVNSLTELKVAYQAMCEDCWTEMGKGIGTHAIVEEYIDGEEFSIEGYVQNNFVTIVSITKKILGPEPYFVEMGHIVPALISAETAQDIQDYVNNVLRALQFNIGVFHCELRVTREGPVLIEIAGRLAGDKIPDLILLSSGINLYEIMLKTLLDEKIILNLNDDRRYAAIKYFAPEINSYRKLNGISELQSLEGFHSFKQIISPNEPIPALKSFLGRAAYVILTAPNYGRLCNEITHAHALIKFQ